MLEHWHSDVNVHRLQFRLDLLHRLNLDEPVGAVADDVGHAAKAVAGGGDDHHFIAVEKFVGAHLISSLVPRSRWHPGTV